MKNYLFDTSALLTLRDNEAGADQVAEILHQAQQHKALCYGCFMSQMEVLYCVWKDENEEEARLAYQQCLLLPMEWVHESQALLEKAAEIKSNHPLSLADGWIAAAVLLQRAALVHKDPEFEALSCRQIVLPYK
ncbi:MAG: PIN domain-containing protein [Methylococcaceae bacterium]|nr:PIN domain-containing protein [Methylococcaceae bacterium]